MTEVVQVHHRRSRALPSFLRPWEQPTWPCLARVLSWLELLALDAGRVGVPFAQSLDERAIRLGLDDPVELGAISGHEAHAVDQHVIHLPAAVAEVHPVIDPYLAPPLSDDVRPHRRIGAIDDLARVGDPLTRVGPRCGSCTNARGDR